MAQLQFDASQVAPSTGVADPVPAGWYDVMMTDSELKPTKDSATTGNAYLASTYEIVSGQYKGRKLFHNFNIRNTNQQAQEIAYRDLSAVCHAVGLLSIQDTQQLHQRPLKVKVTLKPAEGQYEAKNEIRAFKNINEVVGTAGAPAAAPAFGAPPASPQFQQPAAAPAFPQNNPQFAAPAQQFQQPAAPQQFQQPAQVAAPQQPAQQFTQPAPAMAQPPQGFQQPQVPQAPAQGFNPAAAPIPPWMGQPQQ